MNFLLEASSLLWNEYSATHLGDITVEEYTEMLQLGEVAEHDTEKWIRNQHTRVLLAFWLYRYCCLFESQNNKNKENRFAEVKKLLTLLARCAEIRRTCFGDNHKYTKGANVSAKSQFSEIAREISKEIVADHQHQHQNKYKIPFFFRLFFDLQKDNENNKKNKNENDDHHDLSHTKVFLDLSQLFSDFKFFSSSNLYESEAPPQRAVLGFDSEEKGLFIIDDQRNEWVKKEDWVADVNVWLFDDLLDKNDWQGAQSELACLFHESFLSSQQHLETKEQKENEKLLVDPFHDPFQDPFRDQVLQLFLRFLSGLKTTENKNENCEISRKVFVCMGLACLFGMDISKTLSEGSSKEPKKNKLFFLSNEKTIYLSDLDMARKKSTAARNRDILNFFFETKLLETINTAIWDSCVGCVKRADNPFDYHSKSTNNNNKILKNKKTKNDLDKLLQLLFSYIEKFYIDEQKGTFIEKMDTQQFFNRAEGISLWDEVDHELSGFLHTTNNNDEDRVLYLVDVICLKIKDLVHETSFIKEEDNLNKKKKNMENIEKWLDLLQKAFLVCDCQQQKTKKNENQPTTKTCQKISDLQDDMKKIVSFLLVDPQ